MTQFFQQISGRGDRKRKIEDLQFKISMSFDALKVAYNTGSSIEELYARYLELEIPILEQIDNFSDADRDPIITELNFIKKFIDNLRVEQSIETIRNIMAKAGVEEFPDIQSPLTGASLKHYNLNVQDAYSSKSIDIDDLEIYLRAAEVLASGNLLGNYLYIIELKGFINGIKAEQNRTSIQVPNETQDEG